MRISSYATLLDEYSEHNFCTGSLSSKALATESYHDYLERQSDRRTNKQQTTLLLLFLSRIGAIH